MASELEKKKGILAKLRALLVSPEGQDIEGSVADETTEVDRAGNIIPKKKKPTPTPTPSGN